MAHVYVDAPVHAYGRMIMCHMVSPDLDALHAMADLIGVQRKWFQDPLTMPAVSAPHYDIAKVKRALAVEAGAREIDKYQMSVMSKVALHNLYGRTDLDPFGLFRRLGSQKLPGLEAWLAAELDETVLT
jgi:hypothetical protein